MLKLSKNLINLNRLRFIDKSIKPTRLADICSIKYTSLYNTHLLTSTMNVMSNSLEKSNLTQ